MRSSKSRRWDRSTSFESLSYLQLAISWQHVVTYMKHKKLQTLDYNVRLADLQQTYARLAARTLERNTFVQVNKIREL